jgi:hypothetical protein
MPFTTKRKTAIRQRPTLSAFAASQKILKKAPKLFWKNAPQNL